MSNLNGAAVVIGNGSAVVDDFELIEREESREQLTVEQVRARERAAIARHGQHATVYATLQTALGDFRKDRAALTRVLNLTAGQNVLPSEHVHRKVSALIEQRLISVAARVAHNAGVGKMTAS